MKKTWWIILGVAAFAGMGALSFFLLRPAPEVYPQSTPDDVIDAAVRMVKAGDVKRLPTLIYAEDPPEMRALLARVGELLDGLKLAAKEISQKFPAEVETLRKETSDAAASGTASSPLAILAGLRAAPPKISAKVGDDGKVNVATKNEAGDDPEMQMQRQIVRLLADPFSWIEESRPRLSTTMISDDVAAVLVDGKPFAGIGLPLKRVNGKWFFVLPTDLARAYMPRTRDEWVIIASVIKTVENAVRDVAADVHTGKIGSLSRVAQVTGERSIMVVVPVLIYAKEMDARRLTDRTLAELRTREGTWSQARRAAGQDAAALTKTLDAVNIAAAKAFDDRARDHAVDKQENMPTFAALSDAELVAAMEAWLSAAGAHASLSNAISMEEAERIAKAVETWKTTQETGTQVKKVKPAH